MRKFHREKQMYRVWRWKWLMVIIWLAIFFLAALQLLASNRLANLGEEIEKERRITETLIAQNRILEEELRQRESLVYLTQEAQKLGFVEAKSYYYLVPQIPVAMK